MGDFFRVPWDPPWRGPLDPPREAWADIPLLFDRGVLLRTPQSMSAHFPICFANAMIGILIIFCVSGQGVRRQQLLKRSIILEQIFFVHTLILTETQGCDYQELGFAQFDNDSASAGCTILQDLHGLYFTAVEQPPLSPHRQRHPRHGCCGVCSSAQIQQFHQRAYSGRYTLPFLLCNHILLVK